MNKANLFTQEILNETSWYDITEEYALLLREWYGEDLSLFDPNDEDFADSVRRLTKTFRYWRAKPQYLITPYEKLRNEYECLVEVHAKLMMAYLDIHNGKQHFDYAYDEPVSRTKSLVVDSSFSGHPLIFLTTLLFSGHPLIFFFGSSSYFSDLFFYLYHILPYYIMLKEGG
jgi:hypothetical protein